VFLPVRPPLDLSGHTCKGSMLNPESSFDLLPKNNSILLNATFDGDGVKPAGKGRGWVYSPAELFGVPESPGREITRAFADTEVSRSQEESVA